MGSNRKQSDGGCFGAVIALLIILALIVMGVTAVGDFLGLTPSVSEISDRPDGWVTRHYEGVAVGYGLTVLLIALVAAAIWLAIWTQSEAAERAAMARYWLTRVGWAGGALVAAILVLPIGKRDNIREGIQVAGTVPRVVGMSAAQADAKLSDASLHAYYEEIPPDDDECRVVAQDPRPGAELEEFSEVNLRCNVLVPRVVGRKAEVAESRLSDRGVEARFVNEPRDFDLSRCRVRRQSQSGMARPNVEISLRLRCRQPPPPEPTPQQFAAPAENCDPNYEPCVPPYPPDVDCDDVGTSVAVVGDDPHGLDEDRNGVGCQ